MELAGGDEPVPAEQRDYVKDVRAASTAADKIWIYADALAQPGLPQFVGKSGRTR
jgi:hypothetical protein